LRAAQGMRDSDAGIQKITDEVTRSDLRRAARRIQFASPIAALVLTGVSVWLTRLLL
jgi:hypothetical protein